jgi:hypothetical protein
VAAGVFVPAGATSDRVPAALTLHFQLFVQTTQRLNSIVWTGTQFLYVENTTNTVWSAPAAGQPLAQFATMPNVVEETRCVLSPGNHGFPPGAIFCHSPDHKIYEISPDGLTVTVFARLSGPYPPRSDGALAFDLVGRFGYRMIAATGGSSSSGGAVYVIGPHHGVRRVGTYAGPGGADELAIAPRTFGSAGGDALLTVDAGKKGGRVVAVAPNGRSRTLATFPLGPNPIAQIPAPPTAARAALAPFPGLYVSDDITGNTYVTPTAPLARYAGDVIVGSESPRPLFWILKPKAGGFAKISLLNDLPAGNYSLEQAIFVR